jgi:hypothetical protein
MSISPETSPSPSPSSSVSRPRAAKAAIAAAAAVAFSVGLFVGASLMPAFQLRREQDVAMRPWIEEAKLWPMNYETAEPGRIVDWCIDNVGSTAVLDGKGSQPILWANAEFVPDTGGVQQGGRCRRMLARVVRREPLGLKLLFLGAP